MPRGTVNEKIPANISEVFPLLHDYDERLECDTLLQAAYLTEGFARVENGAVTICRGKRHLGGTELKTVYLPFCPPNHVAVTMINQPVIFASFAASIRQKDFTASHSFITYAYHFTARPKCLRFLLHPIMNLIFRW